MESYLQKFIETFSPKYNRIRIVERLDPKQFQFSQFSLTERKYVKNLFPEEIQFMRYILPTKAKFLPSGEYPPG